MNPVYKPLDEAQQRLTKRLLERVAMKLSKGIELTRFGQGRYFDPRNKRADVWGAIWYCVNEFNERTPMAVLKESEDILSGSQTARQDILLRFMTMEEIYLWRRLFITNLLAPDARSGLRYWEDVDHIGLSIWAEFKNDREIEGEYAAEPPDGVDFRQDVLAQYYLWAQDPSVLVYKEKIIIA